MVLSRRRFLEGAVALGTSCLAAEVIPGYSWADFRERRETASARLRITAQSEPNSLLFGSFRPDEQSRGDDLSKITVLFPQWDNWEPENCRRINDANKLPMITIGPMGTRGLAWSELKQHPGRLREQVRQFEDLWVLVRGPGWEVNGNWYHWPRGQDYIDGYKAVSDEFHSLVPGARMVFCINTFYPWQDMFPKDSVDLLALDGYRKVSNLLWNPRHYFAPDLSLRQTFGPEVAEFQEVFPDKKILISEIGSDAEEPFSIDWIKSALMKFPLWQNVVGVCLFLENKAGSGFDEANWDLTRSSDWGKIEQTIIDERAYFKGKATPMELMDILTRKRTPILF